ncbi:hypothetical protein NDU88_005046 [Pleurodeles waltl]|uniref:Uncharacterized protein n=1 Tax=Pleurodeles waltl TaxID=8319 RepID=A0AAV7PHG4_PLEWA|nr:hypothetical protein NDU88_005046 [Pleurodeles waltl]
MTAALVSWIWKTNLAHQGPPDSQLPRHSHAPPQSLSPQETPPQHPPSRPIPLFPRHVNQKYVHHYRDPRPLHKPKTIRVPGVRGSGHTVQGTEAQDNREAGRTAVRQGKDRPREPTLQEALTEILGAYQHFQNALGQILAHVEDNRRLQEGQYQGIREDLQAINSTMVSIAGVLADMGNTMQEAVAQQWAPDTSQNTEQPSTAAAATEVLGFSEPSGAREHTLRLRVLPVSDYRNTESSW